MYIPIKSVVFGLSSLLLLGISNSYATQSESDQLALNHLNSFASDLTNSDAARITASGENGTSEGRTKAFDNSTSSKWLTFSSTGWIAYQLDKSATLSRYSISSANDVPSRDPQDWQLQGSADGANWNTVDSRSGQSFSTRFEKKEYVINNASSYSYYRLNVTRNNGASILQLSELELIGEYDDSTNPGDTKLTKGVAVTGLSDSKNGNRYFRIDVPAGASNLTFNTTGSQGDADLYIKFGSRASKSDYECRSETSSSNETCSIAAPKQGTYFATIFAWSNYSGVSIKANYAVDTGSDVVELSNEQTVGGLSDNKNALKRFKLNVPSNANKVTFKLSGGSGDADLFVKYASEASENNYDCRSVNSNSNESCVISSVTAGYYYATILAYSNYSNVSITASYSTTSNDDWGSVASPNIEYHNDDSPGGKLFKQLVPNIEPYIHDIAKGVVQTLYKSPSEVPAFSTLEFRIERWHNDPNGVAWKAGNPPRITVNVNAYHLERINNKGGNVAEEVKGVLYHEMTHAYQHFTGVELPAIEGLADTVRYLRGYIDISNRYPGGHWTNSYKTTAFFFAWIQEEKGFPDFTYCFNQQAHPNNQGVWSWDGAMQACTGYRTQSLWNEYQAWLK
ncbi:basic secretory protein-like protein [Aliikangiella sp. IMCC44359]|uniref:basic secretory protein-like protein n=1 Tax=Aliikangiella sp. IMCC44359 TaxID=3459125 RepID=UPI00403A923A